MNEINGLSSLQSGNIEPIQYIQKVLTDIEDDITTVSKKYNIDVNSPDDVNYSLIEDDVNQKNFLTELLDMLKNLFGAKQKDQPAKENSLEAYDDIIKEFKANVPDKTISVEQKEKALEYIKRIKNSDASDEDKAYWEQRETVIKGEINRMFGKKVKI